MYPRRGRSSKNPSALARLVRKSDATASETRGPVLMTEGIAFSMPALSAPPREPFPSSVGGAMGIAAGAGAQGRGIRRRSPSWCVHIDPLQRRSLTFLTALQAAFRTNTGSSRSASRYSMRNDRSIGPSPGLPRGGGIADRCDGVGLRSLRATPRQFPLHPYSPPAIPIAPLQPPGNSHCAPTGRGQNTSAAPRKRQNGSGFTLHTPRQFPLRPPTYRYLNPQKGKSSMYSPTLPGLFSLLATSHSVVLRSCVLRGSSRFQLG